MSCAETSDDSAALSDAALAKALSQIAADILATERVECALIWEALAKDFPIQHREDCGPCALLGVDLVASISAPPSDEGAYMTRFVGAPR